MGSAGSDTPSGTGAAAGHAGGGDPEFLRRLFHALRNAHQALQNDLSLLRLETLDRDIAGLVDEATQSHARVLAVLDAAHRLASPISPVPAAVDPSAVLREAAGGVERPTEIVSSGTSKPCALDPVLAREAFECVLRALAPQGGRIECETRTDAASDGPLTMRLVVPTPGDAAGGDPLAAYVAELETSWARRVLEAHGGRLVPGSPPAPGPAGAGAATVLELPGIEA